MNTRKGESIIASLSDDEAAAIVRTALESAGIPYKEEPDKRPTPKSFLVPSAFVIRNKDQSKKRVRLKKLLVPAIPIASEFSSSLHANKKITEACAKEDKKPIAPAHNEDADIALKAKAK